MAHTADPPQGSIEMEFTVTVHWPSAKASTDEMEREIAEAVAAKLNARTTADYQVPF